MKRKLIITSSALALLVVNTPLIHAAIIVQYGFTGASLSPTTVPAITVKGPGAALLFDKR